MKSKTNETNEIKKSCLNILYGFGICFGILSPSSLTAPTEVQDTEDLTVYYHEQKEKQCAIEALWFEARGQSVKGMQAVLDVIQNRKNTKGFPNTICGVIDQPKQFSYKDGMKQGHRLDIKPYNAIDRKTYAKVLRVVDNSLKGRSKPLVKSDVLWYTKVKVKTTWMKKMKVQVVIDDHKFMSLKGEKV